MLITFLIIFTFCTRSTLESGCTITGKATCLVRTRPSILTRVLVAFIDIWTKKGKIILSLSICLCKSHSLEAVGATIKWNPETQVHHNFMSSAVLLSSSNDILFFFYSVNNQQWRKISTYTYLIIWRNTNHIIERCSNDIKPYDALSR